MNTGQNKTPEPTRIEPATFQIGINAPEPAKRSAGLRTALLIGATGTLAFIVFVVIFVLPGWVAETAVVTPSDDGARVTTSAPVVQEPVDPATDPAAETASDPAARENTQARLRETLEQLTMLEAISAEKWAKSELHEIRERIAEGEKAYREKRYVTAQNIYLDTSTRVERLLSEVPNIVESLIDAGKLALEQGDSASATTAFQQILGMDPTNAAAVRGLSRAATLDQVLALVGQAEGYERLGQTDKALDSYREALALDAETASAAAAVQRLQRGQRSDAFRAAMSAGLRELERNNFAKARAAFERAAKLDPDRSEVTDALRQVANAESSYHIERHLLAARQAETDENWEDAFKQFADALKYDERLSPALAGKRRADLRRRLDKHLRDLLAQTERLSSDSVHAEATRLLAEARKLDAGGTRIKRQIAALDRALELAHTPIELDLRSDRETEVTLFKVSELGRFEQRKLSLMPGRYVALGKRDGYRDVRVEFTLKHGDANVPITIQCQEKFAFGN